MLSSTELSKFLALTKFGEEIYVMCTISNSPSASQNSASLLSKSLLRSKVLQTVFRPFPTRATNITRKKSIQALETFVCISTWVTIDPNMFAIPNLFLANTNFVVITKMALKILNMLDFLKNKKISETLKIVQKTKNTK